MHRLCVLSDDKRKSGQLQKTLTGTFEVQMMGLEDVARCEPDQFPLVDLGLRSASAQPFELRDWLKGEPKDSKAMFVIDKSARIEVTRAYAIGATDVLHRPVDANDVLKVCMGEFAVLAGDQSNFPVKDAPG